MTPRLAGPVAVVVAATEARGTVRASLARFLDEVDGRGQVVLVDASRDGTADEAERAFPGLRVLRRPPGWLAPELWRDGLDATDAPLVAFSTAQMVPCQGWLSALLGRLDVTGAAAVGGPIEPAPGLAPGDRALYWHRFVNYLRPMPDTALNAVEPPGDNALYRRDRLVGLEPLWERGFWEVEVHRHLRLRGERLAMADDAAVEFLGGTRLLEAIRRRQAHARHYGADRASRMGPAHRLARSAAAPLVLAVMLRRLVAALTARGQALGPWLPALPGLALLLAAWTLGEARGTWAGPPAPEIMAEGG
ncbi:MAG: glycosyltransferase [Planctomycetaceae bacterium]|nr:glycosyltransferase [Planctomycetaceae bacterium]